MERLIKYFVPEKYELRLQFYLDEKKFSGLATIHGEAKCETVKLHAVNLNIKSVSVNGEPADYRLDDGVLAISYIKKGDVEIYITYDGVLNENMEGVYLSTYEYEGRTETIIATQFESHYARQAFPCVDEPEAKAIFELKMEMSDKFDGVMISNMPENGGNGDMHVFEPTPRMSTYLLAWVIGKLHGKTVTNKHGVKISTYAPLNQEIDSVDFANEVAARALEYYDDNFGVPYPLEKLDQVALPDFEAGAMENWGLVTYRESMLLASSNATLGTKKSVALTVTHELAHQWFGDLVTMKWWDDLWLNESFASVMEYYATDCIYPEFKIFENFFVGDALAALRRDAYSGVQSVHQDVHSPEEIATLFDGAIVYAKGARLMLMLIRAMGWDDFCKGIKDYFEKHKYGNTIGDDLWKALNEYAEFDVKKMMHAFIDQSGYPVIENEGDNFRKFTQKRFLIDGKMEKSDWPIPEISEDMSGHYILNLNDEEFKDRLSRFDELSLEEKLRLLIDRSLIVKTDLASTATLLPLIMEFKHENSAAVWSIVSLLIGTIKPFFEYGTDEQKKFAKYVGELVAPKLTEIGLVTREGDDENTLRLRAILLALDFYAKTEKNLKKLSEMYNKDLTKIDNEIRADVLDAKVYCEPEVIDELLKEYANNADPEIKYDILFALTLSLNNDNLHKMMKLLNDTDTVKPQDQFYLFLYLYRNPLVKKEVFDWLTKNWDYVRNLAGDKSIENYPRYIARGVRTEEEKKAYVQFFSPMKDDDAVSRAIMIGLNEIDAQLETIEKDKKSVYETLDAMVED